MGGSAAVQQWSDPQLWVSIWDLGYQVDFVPGEPYWSYGTVTGTAVALDTGVQHTFSVSVDLGILP